jgi:hypothetical protein
VRIQPLMIALSVLAMTPSAGEAAPPELAQWLSPRPQIQHYQDRDAFVADILAWRRERDMLAAMAARGELPSLPPGAAAEHDPDDWHKVTGPEDLDTAVSKAHGYEQPHYQEPLRFNRTTHVSFPLEHLPAETMADNVVDSTLNEQGMTAKPHSLPGLLLNELDVVTRLPATLNDAALAPTSTLR